MGENNQIFLGLGSNLGNRSKYLKEACQFLEALPLGSFRTSSIYETEPYGGKDQPSYYNQVVSGVTSYSPQQLLNACLQTEKKMGRIRTEHWGSRIIDIDILYYGSQKISLKKLTIPHYDLHNRSFVLMPMNEIAPKWIDPVYQKKIEVLWKNWKENTNEPLPTRLEIS